MQKKKIYDKYGRHIGDQYVWNDCEIEAILVSYGEPDQEYRVIVRKAPVTRCAMIHVEEEKWGKVREWDEIREVEGGRFREEIETETRIETPTEKGYFIVKDRKEIEGLIKRIKENYDMIGRQKI